MTARDLDPIPWAELATRSSTPVPAPEREPTSTAATMVDADEFCRFAGQTITRGYRSDIDRQQVRNADQAHGRIWARTFGRGHLPTTDADVIAVVHLAAVLDYAERPPALRAVRSRPRQPTRKKNRDRRR